MSHGETQIGIDVGGTFTDVVALDTTTGATTWTKVPTNVHSPSAGVLTAIEATGVPYSRIAGVRLGTTLGVNAILTRSGAKTGLITTAGFRDVLEIRRTHRESLFDLNERFPEPLVPRHLRLEVRERVGADGDVVHPLEEDDVRAAWRRLSAAGVEAVAVVLLFSFENPAHEWRIRELLLEEGADVPIFLSSEVLPAYREYERTSTTVVAAYIAGAVDRYVRELDDELVARGLPRGRLAIMTNSGGAMTAGAVARLPVSTILSGPVGGVEASRRLAARAGWSSALTLDMGGTSCDVSGIVDGIADERLDMVVDGHTVSYPTYDIETIGAGGGSIAWIDSGGVLRVGPQSAASRPGPACYGRGGDLPTVTDANLVLGRYDRHAPLGGRIVLDPNAARTAIERHVAGPLGVSVEDAAAGILKIVNVLMTNAVRMISVERGRDTRDFTLVAFGGAGPTHGAEIAQALAVPRVLVPPFPGCASAFGAVVSGSRHDFVRTIGRRVDELDLDTLRSLAADYAAQATVALAEEGFTSAATRVEIWLDVRYAGQAHELSVPHPHEEPSETSVADAVAAFHKLHAELYGHSFADVPVELVNLRVKGFGTQPEPPMWWDWERVGGGEEALARTRRVYFEEAGALLDTRVLLRSELEPGDSLGGPAVIHQVDSTALVPPGFVAEALESGSLVLHAGRRAEPDAELLAAVEAAQR
jgi:N-methylhydantoinase A